MKACTALQGLENLCSPYCHCIQVFWECQSVYNFVGMVVITSGCATFTPWTAAIGGIIGGLVYLPSTYFYLNILKVDDPVEAVGLLDSKILLFWNVHLTYCSRRRLSCPYISVHIYCKVMSLAIHRWACFLHIHTWHMIVILLQAAISNPQHSF